jgi:SAM-dependent methyltransferase
MSTRENTRAHARQHDAKGVAERYWEGMDRSMPQKLALMAGLMLLDKGALVVDAGCGSGAASYYLARLNPQVRVIGIDLDPQAIEACRKRYPAPNLSFQCGNVAEPLGLEADAILSSSTLHHVFTFSDPAYSTDAVRRALASHAESLKPGGVLALRDFVVPDDPGGLVVLSLISGTSAAEPAKMDEPDLLLEFSRTARPLDRALGPGFPVEELMPQITGRRRFRLARRYAAEFLLRKDYRADWPAELQEQYGYFTAGDFLGAFAEAGLADARAVPVLNPWILANRWEGKAELSEEDGRKAPWPNTNLLVSGRKAPRGASVRVQWQQALPAAGYLKVSHWRSEAEAETFTIAERPAHAVELLPWAMADGRLRILARDGYPRPIATAADRHHPGRTIEPIAYSGDPDALVPLVSKLGLQPAAGAEPIHHLSFLPSAGGIAERAECYHLALETLPPPRPSTGPLARAGVIRSFDAQDILRAGQVGALDEARLEIATAFLLRAQGMPLDAWTGETPPLLTTDRFPAVDFAALLAQRDAGFVPHATPERPWFAIRRGRFKDVDGAGRAVDEVSLEWAEPFSGSPASASILAVAKQVDGTILIGIEMRQLPAAQALTGNAALPCVPAWRLPTRPASPAAARAMLAQRLGFAEESGLTALGGAYFSSLGITTERVYPFIGDALSLPSKITAGLAFCRLSDVLAAAKRIADGHLLIAASRAAHLFADPPAE